MKDQYDGELISSLVDGELDDIDHHKAIDSIIDDKEACRCWERYHLMSDALKRNLPGFIDYQLASRVMAELQNEPAILAPHSRSQSSPTLTKRLAGLAVAASVATIAVLGTQMLYRKDGVMPSQQYAQVPGIKNTEIASMGGAEISKGDIQKFAQSLNKPTLAAENDIQNNPYINKYLLDHNQHAARGAVQGVMPYVRIIIDPEMKEIIRQKQSQLQTQRQ